MTQFYITFCVICALTVSYGCGPRVQSVPYPGPKGDTGATGSQGTPGNDGATGPQGLPGIDTTQIEAHAFCPDLPGAGGFQESYLLLDGSLYAVYYSPPKTFLARLLPGNYVTTDGRSCYFTVNANNTVSYP